MASRISSERSGIGPYDELYRAPVSEFLWGAPGRLVERADEWLPRGSNVLDAGCGDGKNALRLEAMGHRVVGFDVSDLAMTALRRRFAVAGRRPSGQYSVGPLEDFVVSAKFGYDAVVSYGLLHCLPPERRVSMHRQLQGLVRPGGVLMFSALLDTRDIPADHATPGVTPVSNREIRELFDDDWTQLHYEAGSVEEHHLPVVGRHEHDVVWLVARRTVAA